MPDRRLGPLRVLGPSTLAACALIACALAACARTPAPTPAPQTLRLTGSTAAAPLLGVLGPAFEKRRPAIELVLDVDRLGAAHAAQAQALVREGAFPLAVVAGAPPADLWSAPLAVDALALVVHADNPLPFLTLAQLRQIYVGRIWHWSELGVQVPEDEIVVISREPGSGTRAVFEDLALRAQPGEEPAPVTTAAVLRFGGAAVVDYVAEHPAAIGYVALGALEDRALPVRALVLEDAAPGPEAVAQGAYPLSLPLYLVAPSEPVGAARQFLDFCLSPEGQRLVGQAYVPVR